MVVGTDKTAAMDPYSANNITRSKWLKTYRAKLLVSELSAVPVPDSR